jgi:hypothetical protein
MKSVLGKMEKKIMSRLSRRPKLYALIVGVGIVLFWRGVWHSADHLYSYYSLGPSALGPAASSWWDGPLSFLLGIVVLYFTGAFTSSFIGNELILSGLRGERRLTEKTESEVETEIRAVFDIKDALRGIEEKITLLEKKVRDHHSVGEKK